jgi:myo-inositol-1(or 4)-monophosphatase
VRTTGDHRRDQAATPTADAGDEAGDDAGAAMRGARLELGAAERRVVDAARSLTHGLLDELGRDLLEDFGGAPADLKDDGSLVTPADVEANDRIVTAIADRFPGHEVVSEELGTTYEGGEWCWVVDPIDGTTNFVRGLPAWCVSVGLAFQGWPVVGVVDAPALARRYEAVRRGGSFRDGNRLAVRDVDWSDPVTLKNDVVAGSSGLGRHYVIDLPLRPRVVGAAALHLCLAAEGAVVAAIHPSPKVWDVAAGLLIVEEAGGVMLDVGEDPPFPLRAGVDYARVEHRFVVAASEQTARRVLNGLRPR